MFIPLLRLITRLFGVSSISSYENTRSSTRLFMHLQSFKYSPVLISETSRKVNALSRVMPYMNLSKKEETMSSLFNSQFNYCPLIWMFHSHIINNKINRLNERCLHLLYGDKLPSFEKLLEQDTSVTIHTRNLQILATEMFKVY